MADEKRSGPSPRLTPRGAATRERIVSAAADLMYAQGVAGTSLADVMAASGTGTSQLYHYFTDKDALVAEVVLTEIARMLETQERLLGRVDSLRGLRRWRDAEVLQARSRGQQGCPSGRWPATCWIVVTKDGRYAYTANFDSGTISSYSIAGDGKVTLQQGAAATLPTGSHSTGLSR